ncbi:MAG: hypothetical protein CMN73_14170 [Sphingomonas sp.]|nr:hypothetical protein [Sphingomonas sp.]|tara:strand:- start:1014 stop:1814 length:801 start_codon:yes stop_codon:yes gene_type:complete
MRIWVMAGLCLSLPAAAQAQAQSQAQTQNLAEHRLQENWVGSDGNSRIAQISLRFDRPDGADPAMVRRLELNWSDYPYQQGNFPVPVGDAEVRATVKLTLSVDDQGVPQACTVQEPSGVAGFDDHACPHLLRYLRFYPALTDGGERTGGTLDVAVGYRSGRIMVENPAGGGPTAEVPRPVPVTPIDAASVGFGPDDGLPRNIYGISGALRVETDGSVSACTLDTPTQVDAFDLAACNRLRAIQFQPARERNGTPVATDYAFWVSRR